MQLKNIMYNLKQIPLEGKTHTSIVNRRGLELSLFQIILRCHCTNEEKI